NSLEGELEVPGDKSISHRGLILGALADGESRVSNLAPGNDVQSTLDCLEQLGVRISREECLIQIMGEGLGGLSQPQTSLHAGNSGTLMRLLSGVLAGHSFQICIKGDESLNQRPMERIAIPLRKMGARIRTRNGNPPLEILGGELRGIEYSPEVASAQVKSCVILAGLHADGVTKIIEPGPSRDHTEVILRAVDYPLEVKENVISLRGEGKVEPFALKVPGDFSSAAFFITAGLLAEDSEILLKDVGLNDTRTGFLELARRMGGEIVTENLRSELGEPKADLLVRSSSLKGITIRGTEVVKAIDELPLVAILGSQAEGATVIKDAEELRVKETDRIQATVHNLRALGVEVEGHPDGLSLEGPCNLSGARLRSFSDHRIAMAFSVAGLFAKGKSYVENSSCVKVSYPDFFRDLEELKNA
ncbi:MAG: 3-phosphoshikimate 1-carboxyvinyltransferase, partial [Candidatus Bipolaricaulota bacterium]